MNLQRNRLEKISQMLKHLENKKITAKETIINEILKELIEEEKMSRFYLQVTQSNTASQARKKAMLWNSKVIELKQRLFAIKI